MEASAKPGFEVARLIKPTELNEDFICKICSSKFNIFYKNFHTEIVNKPLECANSECGVLYCTFCLSKPQTPKKCLDCSEISFRTPSQILLRSLNQLVL